MAASSRGRRSKAKRKVERDPLAAAREAARATTDPSETVRFLTHEDASVRLLMLRRLCPCKLQASAGREEFEPVWDAIFTLVTDECPKVRSQVLHTICDGSPAVLESEVAAALEVFNRDSDKVIRRAAHKVLAAYARTGKWNVM